MGVLALAAQKHCRQGACREGQFVMCGGAAEMAIHTAGSPGCARDRRPAAASPRLAGQSSDTTPPSQSTAFQTDTHGGGHVQGLSGRDGRSAVRVQRMHDCGAAGAGAAQAGFLGSSGPGICPDGTATRDHGLEPQCLATASTNCMDQEHMHN